MGFKLKKLDRALRHISDPLRIGHKVRRKLKLDGKHLKQNFRHLRSYFRPGAVSGTAYNSAGAVVPSHAGSMRSISQLMGGR